MNGRPARVDRGRSWNLEFFFHYLDQVTAKVNHVFGARADLRFLNIQMMQISSFKFLKMTNNIWARCQQVDVFLRSFVFPLPRDDFPRIESYFSS